MHAVDESLVFRLKHFGGRHIGEDHEFLDVAMRRLEPWRGRDGLHRALFVEDDLAFGKVEIERSAFVAGDFQRGVGLVKWHKDSGMERAHGLVRSMVDQSLRLRIGEFRRRAHHNPMETMA